MTGRRRIVPGKRVFNFMLQLEAAERMLPEVYAEIDGVLVSEGYVRVPEKEAGPDIAYYERKKES